MGKKRGAFLLAVLFLLMSVTTVWATETDEAAAEAVSTEETAQDTSVSLEGITEAQAYTYKFETVAENGIATLLIDKKVNALRIVDNATGQYYDTKVMNGQLGNSTVKSAQKSDFNLIYYKDKVKGSTTLVDSQSQSVDFGQVEYEAIDNGIRCLFTVGDAGRVKLTQFPQYISTERLEELVLQYLDSKQKTDFLKEYYTSTSTRVVRNWNTYKKDGTPQQVPLIKLQKMYEYFYVIGNYTVEELAIDNEAWGEPTFEQDPLISVVVEYRLDGGDLVVTVPRDGMFFMETQPFSSITLNPYLLSADFNDSGYFYVPDGSGGIIEFNNGKSRYDAVIPVYGKDPLKNVWQYSETFEQANLPIVGMVKNGNAVLGIIEEGAPIATINANTSGRVDEFNKVSVTFEMLYREKVYLRGSTTGSTMDRYLAQVYGGDITMRYIFLTGEDANYVGMAKAYKQYLKDRGAIKENAVADDAPFFAEIIAATPRQKMFLGIPYTQQFPMTTTREAEQILQSLSSLGIKNIHAQYTQWTNGGLLGEALDKIKPIASIGGTAGIKQLEKFCEDMGINLYPAVNAMTIFKQVGLFGTTNRSMLTRGINNMMAWLATFDRVERTLSGNASMLSPRYWLGYAQRLANNFEKITLKNISVVDAGTLLYGDYGKKNQVTRREALPYAQEALQALTEKTGLMLTNANDYAFQYADVITDLPYRTGGRRLVDYYVPFVQMVLENDIPYALPAYNEDVMAWRGFEEYLLKAVESKSGLKLFLTAKNEVEFLPTHVKFAYAANRTYFMTEYQRWHDQIGGYYAQYNAFYRQVNNAEMTAHTVYDGGARVRVTYTNGINVYINYGGDPWEIDGVSVAPLSFETR